MVWLMTIKNSIYIIMGIFKQSIVFMKKSALKELYNASHSYLHGDEACHLKRFYSFVFLCKI